jgi:hypothetical protein
VRAIDVRCGCASALPNSDILTAPQAFLIIVSDKNDHTEREFPSRDTEQDRYLKKDERQGF